MCKSWLFSLWGLGLSQHRASAPETGPNNKDPADTEHTPTPDPGAGPQGHLGLQGHHPTPQTPHHVKPPGQLQVILIPDHLKEV